MDELNYAANAPKRPYKYEEPTRGMLIKLMTTGKVPPFYFGKQQINER